MFTINVNNMVFVAKKVRTKLCLLLKISGVEVTPSITPVESPEQFWRKIRQIWCICDPARLKCAKLEAPLWDVMQFEKLQTLQP